jgi:DNA-binding protein HU-beta
VEETVRAKEGLMAKAMTKAQIVGRIADNADITKAAANAILEDLASLAAKEAKNGFTLPGIGKVVLVNRKARMGRNPQTGQPIKIPAKGGVRIRLAKGLKDAILGGK